MAAKKAVARKSKGKKAEPEKRKEEAPVEVPRQERERVEVAPPVRPRCGRCGSERLRQSYTTVFQEAGIRRVTCECLDCGAIPWYDEEWPRA
jgi:uncharacterized protein with PIN domain